MHSSTKQMYQYAIDNQLEQPCCELAYPGEFSENWTIYEDITDHSFRKYNELHNNEYKSKYDIKDDNVIESYSNEPRITDEKI